jgi:hypothetical protein
MPVRKIHGSTDSDDSLAQVRWWLDTCRSRHKCLPKTPSVLPKRVVDVGSSDSSAVKLCETGNKIGQYVCLSHCWGTCRPACNTTLATLEENRRAIDWNMLPKTFQDAIDFTRRLGLRYIWIDSLCIVQDSPDDWNEQSLLMAHIYGNAYVTLCATASVSDNGGCYLQPPHALRSRKINVRRCDGKEYEVYVYHNLPHINWESFGDHLFPLMERGWAFQERLLSPRLVHFVAGELLWECGELSDCGCNHYWRRERGNSFNAPKIDYRRVINTAFVGGDITGHWHSLVSRFSHLNLTFEKDKLPSLSGVVKEMMRLRPGDEYLAGLWRNTLLDDICWFTGLECTRTAVWRCPSWSWAAFDGQVWMSGVNAQRHRYSTILDASVTPTGDDPTGEVTAGHIILSGPVFNAQICRAKPRSWRNNVEVERFDLDGNGLLVQFEVDCSADFNCGLLAVGDHLTCLRMRRDDLNSDFGLVLKPNSSSIISGLPTYQRVGHFQHKVKELERHWYTGEMQPVVVKIV